MFGVCHCANCRRRTGSAFGISAYFPRSAEINRTGEFSVYAYHHKEHNQEQERHFCRNCGTTLFWHVSTLPTLIGIAGGCFTDPALGEPGKSFCDSQKLPWVSLPSSWPCSE